MACCCAEHTGRLWNSFSNSLPGYLLEAVNHVIDVYIGALTEHAEGAYREILPQYICLLRPSLTHVALRRCFTALMPSPPADAYQRSKDGTSALADPSLTHVCYFLPSPQKPLCESAFPAISIVLACDRERVTQSLFRDLVASLICSRCRDHSFWA